ncbi:MAG: CBS domain-containing protein [Aerococcus sp.]|nr:CBS domain-containing protein [Aerococcus sp.]
MQNDFLEAFNQLQSTMAEALDMDPNTEFSTLIQKGNKEKPVIDYYSDDLNFIRQVRNLVVHENQARDDKYLKIQKGMIDLVEKITAAIATPTPVKTLLAEKERVITFNETAPITKVLEEIKNHRYSQFPIFNDSNLISVLTENSIARFLADHLQANGAFNLKKLQVKDLLAQEDIDKSSRAFAVVAVDETEDTIIQLFKQRLSRGETTFIVIVGETHNIQKPSDIMGIITPYDLPRIAEHREEPH